MKVTLPQRLPLLSQLLCNLTYQDGADAKRLLLRLYAENWNYHNSNSQWDRSSLLPLTSILAATAVIAVDDKNHSYLETAATLATVMAVFSALLLLLSLCLLVGAIEGKPALLIPWMVYTLVYLVVNIAVNIFYVVEYSGKSHGQFAAGIIVGIIINLLLELYFLLVVYSLFRELKGTSPPPDP